MLMPLDAYQWKKKYLSEQKPTFSVITGFWTATAGVSRDARDAR